MSLKGYLQHIVYLMVDEELTPERTTPCSRRVRKALNAQVKATLILIYASEMVYLDNLYQVGRNIARDQW